MGISSGISPLQGEMAPEWGQRGITGGDSGKKRPSGTPLRPLKGAPPLKGRAIAFGFLSRHPGEGRGVYAAESNASAQSADRNVQFLSVWAP